MNDFSAATFASLRSELKAKAFAHDGKLEIQQIIEIVDDRISPAIEDTRRYQELQAMVNCTRKSLLPVPVTPELRRQWELEIRQLEAQGIR